MIVLEQSELITRLENLAGLKRKDAKAFNIELSPLAIYSIDIERLMCRRAWYGGTDLINVSLADNTKVYTIPEGVELELIQGFFATGDTGVTVNEIWVVPRGESYSSSKRFYLWRGTAGYDIILNYNLRPITFIPGDEIWCYKAAGSGVSLADLWLCCLEKKLVRY